jgi:signal transduction histidine kinase
MELHHTYELRVEVADSGIGIGEEAQSKLFTSFSQAHREISRTYGGTGHSPCTAARGEATDSLADR